jgi:hypothetical protein
MNINTKDKVDFVKKLYETDISEWTKEDAAKLFWRYAELLYGNIDEEDCINLVSAIGVEYYSDFFSKTFEFTDFKFDNEEECRKYILDFMRSAAAKSHAYYFKS